MQSFLWVMEIKFCVILFYFGFYEVSQFFLGCINNNNVIYIFQFLGAWN